jgi:(p)ppGpp synthase/HD superfamily hydrolase
MDPGIGTRHDKQRAKLERTLLTKGWVRAVAALRLVQEFEEGRVRKDGETPRFHHQVSIARLVYTLTPHLEHPEPTITAAILHDVLEDHGDRITPDGIRRAWGVPVRDAVWRLTKKHQSEVKTYEDYFAEMAICPIASIVKLADRAHNIQTMQGVFTPEKQRAYVEEVSTWFFPLIREARRQHPQQYDAYENLKILLRCQVDLLRHMLGEHP